MILKRDSKRIKELEKINVQHRKLNGNLRQEIDILESQLDFITYQNIVIENLQKENEDYEQRIKKAVEYIKNESYLEEGYMIPVVEKNPLLNILQNGSDDK